MLIDKGDLKVTLKHLSNSESLYRKTSLMSYSIQLTIVGYLLKLKSLTKYKLIKLNIERV